MWTTFLLGVRWMTPASIAWSGAPPRLQTGRSVALHHLHPHTYNAVNVIKKCTPSTAYTPVQLLPIATQKIVDNMNTYNLKQLKTDLQQYCSMGPTVSHVQTVMSKAKAKLRGDTGLPSCQFLQRCCGNKGTRASLLTSAEIIEVLIDVEHNEFLYEQKSKPASERERWDRSKADKYPVEEGAAYCLGWTFSPSTSRK
ncbi:hypothetical protein CYMTET_39056 [Cymbomonas tetramitiformis]|uniref:Uncharacterized protein n=1 Tax=Cymbomonas tetramitiformis TaxID=36881 RepID=A0AAE0CAU0_9CHLO|nr:hypothetical protein CYMTET_39056 [Cymbomonas tetramitiformis]